MTRATKFDPYHLDPHHILGRSLRPEVEILFRLEMCVAVTPKKIGVSRAIFCNKDWDMEHADMKIQQVLVMYLNDEKISRPPAPPIVSP
jgi:hypothetical protein